MATEATKIPFVEAAAPATPAASRVVIYAKSDGLMYSKDDAGAETLMSGGSAGAVATDAIWDAKGDLAVGTGANTAAKLTVGANGTRPEAASGEATGIKWSVPAGAELAYTEYTSPVNCTATTEGTANTIVTAGAFTSDATAVWIEFFAPDVDPVNNVIGRLWLYEDGTSIGELTIWRLTQATAPILPCLVKRKHTPASGSRTYSVRGSTASGTITFGAGAGGAGNEMPGYIRITKA